MKRMNNRLFLSEWKDDLRFARIVGSASSIVGQRLRAVRRFE